MGTSFDFKKEYKDLYLPKTKPAIVAVPQMTFIAIDGYGNPNTAESYKNAMEVLYGLSYSIKMSKMSGTQPKGYIEYVVPPLEGLWWVKEGKFDGLQIGDKDRLHWTSLIRQPDFVTEAVLALAKETLRAKRPHVDPSTARLMTWTEGLCVQVMHVGSYDEEPVTIEAMERFVSENGYINDISETRRHHEIYLSDPRKTVANQLKTVIRHPIRKAS